MPWTTRGRASRAAPYRPRPHIAADPHHRAHRRPPNAAGAEGLRRGRPGAEPLLRPTAGRGGQHRLPRGRSRGAPTAGGAHPIAKSWPAQWCLEANSLAIQVHGGYGYTREYNVEQFYRDNRLNPIHEGTHGIQGLDLLGRKAIADGGAGIGALMARMTATVERARELARAARGPGSTDLVEFADALAAAAQRLAMTTMNVWADRDPALALANASAYLRLPPRRRRVAVAGAGPGGFRQGGCLLRRQAGGGGLFLPLRASQDGSSIRPARQLGPHCAGPASGRAVSEAQAESFGHLGLP